MNRFPPHYHEGQMRRIAGYEPRDLPKMIPENAEQLNPVDIGKQRELLHYHFTPYKCERFSWALSDIICWMDGFRSGGGTYSPNSIEVLRDLNRCLKDGCPVKLKTSDSH